MFHVSQLKKQIKNKYTPQTWLLEINEEGIVIVVPVAILNRHWVKKRNRTVDTRQVLVHRNNGSSEMATWEDIDVVRVCFPNFLT